MTSSNEKTLQINLHTACNLIEAAQHEIALLQNRIHDLEKELAEVYANLTAVQTRCTELLRDNRDLRSSMDHLEDN